MKNAGYYITRLWSFGKSKRLALVLLTCLTLAVVAEAAIIIARWDPGSEIRVSDIVFPSWWFQTLVLLFMLNLSVCTVDSAVRRFRAGVRSLGRWSSAVFHIGLIIVVAGVLITANWRMVGYMGLVRGDTRYEKHDSYGTIQESRFFRERSHRGFSLTLLKQEILYNDKGDIDDVYSMIRVMEGNEVIAEPTLTLAEPYYYRGLYLYCYQAGYAVQLAITDPEGNTRDITVPLETLQWDDGVNTYYLKEYTTKVFPYKLSFNFYPDLVPSVTGNYVNRSHQLRNYGINVSAETGDQYPVSKLLLLNESTKIKGYTFRFKKLKPWTAVKVVNDPGANVVFAGTAVTMAGLSAFYVLNGRTRKRRDNSKEVTL